MKHWKTMRTDKLLGKRRELRQKKKQSDELKKKQGLLLNLSLSQHHQRMALVPYLHQKVTHGRTAQLCVRARSLMERSPKVHLFLEQMESPKTVNHLLRPTILFLLKINSMPLLLSSKPWQPIHQPQGLRFEILMIPTPEVLSSLLQLLGESPRD